MSLREKLIAAGHIRPAKMVETTAVEVKLAEPSTQIEKPSKKPKRYKPYSDQRLKAKLAARAKTENNHEPLRCPLCGDVVAKGGMLDHKAKRHDEKAIMPSPVRITHPPSRPIFVSGGSPGLKKK